MSQPALSKSISRLEESLGVNLFERHKGRIKLSLVGMEYYKYISGAFEQIDAGNKYIENHLSPVNQEVSIASTASDLLNTLVRDFLNRNADEAISVNQFVYHPEMLEKKLIGNEVDFVISSIPIENAQYDIVELLFEEVFLTVSARHRLAKEKTVPFASLRQEKFLVNEYVFDKKIVMRHCELAGFSPNITLCTSENRLLMESLDSNLGVSLVPAGMLAMQFLGHDAAAPQLHIVPLRISDMPVYRIIYLVRQKDRILSPIGKRMYVHTKGYFKQLSEMIDQFTDDLFKDIPKPVVLQKGREQNAL